MALFVEHSGSIPARAGEPTWCLAGSLVRRVDPRACGGASWDGAPVAGSSGRSPRVRGSPAGHTTTRVAAGSIPARAGEPGGPARGRVCLEVDPRACGGATAHTGRERSPRGRSPRVRGSPSRTSESSLRLGSIPARAGEPDTAPPRRRAQRVDPRACGGAEACATKQNRAWGRSPRVRGSPPIAPTRCGHGGSIPARAGEPHRWTHGTGVPRVDPRACGGAVPADWKLLKVVGRSPRVRGSRARSHGELVTQGSIPARAGEPSKCCHPISPVRVDPRACGGACRSSTQSRPA